MNVIKVYGSGCANCLKLTALSTETVNEMGVDFLIEKVEDLQAIVGRGIMQTPALEINGKIVSAGKIPTKSTLQHWIKESLEIQNVG
ncbi:MAG: hypothetical protein CVV23_04675 [Ignavibacteriae bacterium HGW-Ignavibacteriae-2]|jgi:small redox-active disulfide protein 2|nr:MAG: hypothetical protein CVV23_04675 [Ignavibacteriae bacterium HGW-Ignavibacteriae-2]